MWLVIMISDSGQTAASRMLGAACMSCRTHSAPTKASRYYYCTWYTCNETFEGTTLAKRPWPVMCIAFSSNEIFTCIYLCGIFNWESSTIPSPPSPHFTSRRQVLLKKFHSTLLRLRCTLFVVIRPGRVRESVASIIICESLIHGVCGIKLLLERFHSLHEQHSKIPHEVKKQTNESFKLRCF